MVDMHKEIKLSDLFKRGSKDSADAENGNEPKPPKKVKPPKEPKRQKEPKQARKAKDQASKLTALSAYEAPPPADVPLMRAFNLLPREEARAAKEGAAQGPLPYVLVALAGVLVFAALAAFYLMAGTDVTTKKGKIEDLRAELAAYQTSSDQPSLDDKTAALANERAGRTAALASALGKRLAWDRLLREIALVVPDEVMLSQIQGNSPAAASTTTTASADGSPITNLTIIGTTANQASVAEFMTRLSVIRELVAVTLKEAGESPDDPSSVVFTITGTLRLGS